MTYTMYKYISSHYFFCFAKKQKSTILPLEFRALFLT